MRETSPSRWPAMMKRNTVTEYLDLSDAAFEREMFLGRLPGPIVFGGRDHWRKDTIDRALDVLTGDAPLTGEDAPYRRKMRERHARKALERASKNSK